MVAGSQTETCGRVAATHPTGDGVAKRGIEVGRRVVPRRFVCTKKNRVSCSYENCGEFRPYTVYVNKFDTCPRREMER